MIFKSVINGSIEDLSGGLSGCRLSISADGKIVSKYSSDLGYNYRLLEQAKKQEYFKTLQIENIKCPTVLSINSKSDLCFFEMEYIAGSSHLDFLEYSSPLYISAFIDSIFYYFNFVSEGKLESYSNKEFIFLCRKKLESIKDRVPYPGFVEYTDKRISECSYSNVESTFCHGDLTLSNILFSPSSFCFLDFLDSYIESWIIDLVKLKQDLFYQWNLKRNSDSPSLRSVQVSMFIWKSLEDRYGEVISTESFKILETLNFLRIYPYLQTRREKNILDEIIKKTPIYEEFDNSNGR
jgi:hypothetical protein